MPMLAPSHPTYQLANVFLFLSYATTNLLALRVCLTCAGICFLLWGWFVLDYSIDTIVWNGIFVIINVIQTARILAQMFPVKFDADSERIYQHFFAPGKYFMKRAEFKSLVTNSSAGDSTEPVVTNKSQSQQYRDSTNGKSVTLELAPVPASSSPLSPVTSSSPLANHGGSNGNANGASKSTNAVTIKSLSAFHTPSTSLCCIREFEKGAIFANPGDAAQTLSILLSGRIVVEKLRRGFDLASVQRLDPDDEDSKAAWRPLNFIRDMEFLDSPEWAARNATDRPRVWEVRLRFLQTSRVFMWNASSLETILSANSHAESCLSGVVGVDLARKIFCGNVERFALANLDSDEASTKHREEYAQYGFGSAYHVQPKTHKPNNHTAIATTVLGPTTTTRLSGTEGIHDHLYSDANDTAIENQRTGLLAPTSSTLSSFSSFTSLSNNPQLYPNGTTAQQAPSLLYASPSPMNSVYVSPSPALFDHSNSLPPSSTSASQVTIDYTKSSELPLPSRADLTHLVTFAAQSSQPLTYHHQQVEHPMRARIGHSQQPHDPQQQDPIVRFHHDD